MTANKPAYVTRPAMPSLEEFIPYLKEIWRSKILTNNGRFHEQLETALCQYLGVKHLSLFCNGTIALLTAMQALEITGEVITTPFTFVATAHTLTWNGIKPVFADIDPKSFNLSPEKIEPVITKKTAAILPVHVYGTPCDIEGIQEIADTYGLKVIYDAAHAFGVKRDGVSILNFGDLSVLSFHATKTYTTFEGGAIVCHDVKTKDRIDKLKNFGFAGETSVIASGINGKMNEFQAAFGLLYLKHIDEYIARRKKLTLKYRKMLADIPGIRFIEDIEGVTQNYTYFPILVDKAVYGKSRDQVYDQLKNENIFCRRYFYPLVTDFPMYKGERWQNTLSLQMAKKVASQVLCLPIFPELTDDTIERVVNIVSSLSKTS